MRSTIPAAVLLATLTLAGAAANDAPCWTTTVPDFDTGIDTGFTYSGRGNGRYYVDVEQDCESILGRCEDYFPWTLPYEETNGIPGLQRDDSQRSDVDDCTDGTRGDTVM